MIVEKKHTDNFTILYVEGLIKLGESAEFFSSALENVLKNESTNVIVDFTKIDYIDSTGIGELVGYLGKFSNQNRKLVLVNPSERIMKLLKLAKLDAVFKIYGSEEEAIGAESGAQSLSRAKTRDQPSSRAGPNCRQRGRGVAVDPASTRGMNLSCRSPRRSPPPPCRRS